MLKKLVKRPAGRREYAANFLAFTGITAMQATSLAPERWREDPIQFWILAAMFAVLVVAVLSNLLNFSARRLLDLGRSPRRAWLILVPGYNLYLLFVLLTRKGNAAPPADAVPHSPEFATLDWVMMGAGAFGWLFVLVTCIFG